MYFFNKPLLHFIINKCKLTNYWQCVYDSVFVNLFLKKKNDNDNSRTNKSNKGNNFYPNKKDSVCL